ncbi:MAG TPA: RNA 2',3'-cyclic phosphodiesterase [Gammaproteobacteria bacterium]|nr:RNA 2',3'-cyclic phosphodiesterase [Arenicellales bacterium]MDP6551572.1 RNA 2',3'-cyclic phosphodiesterase [Arenicellales bacterium]MDP6790914.1 RNA 2',3'-cyclic phosphodiesterase [Arenicellales bacterium]MDP6918461.1 RNA 2',3'-cyclic phosphodiesterase [Arenicellales bacterium]HCX87852.1 RNA 2',3'-cyclic phosphodiesterase [Gammaproteobacteria bacterium]
MPRLFVAIDIPDSIREELTGWRISVRGARWARPNQMHLTLVFLGEQQPGVYRGICESLEKIEFTPFELQFHKVGYFGSKKSPRTLWADIRESPELLTLQKRVSAQCRELGVEIEVRKFRPHLTLARLDSASYRDVGRFLQMFSLATSAAFTVDSFALFSSKLLPRGAVYRIEQEYPGDR